MNSRRVWLSSNFEHTSHTMYEHVRCGGSLYMLEQENGKAYISTTPSGNTGVCTYADMKYVMQEIRILESANGYLPDGMKSHRNQNGKFYQIGEPMESGNVDVVMDLDNYGLRTMIKQSDIEYVSMAEQYFSAAVDAIPGTEPEMEQ